MLVTLLIPFTGVALGALFLGEALTLRQVAGGLVIALSLLVIDGRLFGVRAEAPATGRGEAQRQSAR
jgi:drug/metabolite transporter (DMT)-like permease